MRRCGGGMNRCWRAARWLFNVKVSHVVSVLRYRAPAFSHCAQSLAHLSPCTAVGGRDRPAALVFGVVADSAPECGQFDLPEFRTDDGPRKVLFCEGADRG